MTARSKLESCGYCSGDGHTEARCPSKRQSEIDGAQARALTDADPDKAREKYREATFKRVAREANAQRRRDLMTDPEGELTRWNLAVKSYGRRRRG